jgi:hypothetical protein
METSFSDHPHKWQNLKKGKSKPELCRATKLNTLQSQDETHIQAQEKGVNF